MGITFNLSSDIGRLRVKGTMSHSDFLSIEQWTNSPTKMHCIAMSHLKRSGWDNVPPQVLVL